MKEQIITVAAAALFLTNTSMGMQKRSVSGSEGPNITCSNRALNAPKIIKPQFCPSTLTSFPEKITGIGKDKKTYFALKGQMNKIKEWLQGSKRHQAAVKIRGIGKTNEEKQNVMHTEFVLTHDSETACYYRISKAKTSRERACVEFLTYGEWEKVSIQR